MLDEFRQQANSSNFFTEEEEAEPVYEEIVIEEKGYFLGMTPVQRFVLSVMLFLIVTLVGTLALLVMGKVMLPI